MNPFESIEQDEENERLKHLATAKALDELEVDVTSWESEFLDSILKQLLNEKRGLSQKQIDILNRMCGRYGIE